MTEILLFGYAFLLGLLFNIIPGAILAESLRRGLRSGFGAAFAVQIGSLAGDGLWVILGVSGAAGIILIPHAALPLMLCGIGYIAYLAWESFRDGLRPMPDFTAQAEMQNRGALLAGVFLSVSNPLNIGYWAALGGTMIAITGTAPRVFDYALFISGFMLSSVLWCFIAAWLIALTRKRLNAMLWRWLHFICGIGLLLVLAGLCASALDFIRGGLA